MSTEPFADWGAAEFLTAYTCSSDDDTDNAWGADDTRPTRGLTLSEFGELFQSDLLALWSKVKQAGRETGSPHLLQYLDYQRFVTLAYRTS